MNLFDAVRRLSSVAAEAALLPNATGSSVTEAVIASAEALLREDVEANKEMGRHGAVALLAAAQARGRATDGKLRVLTHCNTGSLATAAYGTALGVIRALHDQGQLAHAYCTETRPYNQGARLTAFELVTDGLPSTLICDSAAAALMSEGKVDAVVVGADRIAANGDTANKIGTFSLAVLAKYHNIPFFTAAPVTTLDPELRDGSFIPIEQRAAEEITHFKGQRVAAEIDVWNPSFDVTPADLLEGIITEKGLVPRRLGSSRSGREFDVRGWLGGSPQQNGGAGTHTAETITEIKTKTETSNKLEKPFVLLNSETLKDYVAARPALASRIDDRATTITSDWDVTELSDGNLNHVYVIRGPSGAMCIKQAPPYVRCIGEDWPLTQDRVRIESAVLAEQARHCPTHIPTLHHTDLPQCLIVMQFIPPPHAILRKGFIAGTTYPLLADHCSTLLARTLFHTSLLAMDSQQFATQVASFSNVEMCRLTEQVIFTDPYYNAEFNKHTSPQLDAEAEAMRGDVQAKAAAARLKSIFIQKPQALLHGDLHSGSIMATQETTYVIDPEFGFVGPIAFDVGKLLGNLLLAYFAVEGHATPQSPRAAQQTWFLDTIVSIWRGFESKFTHLWETHGTEGDACASPLFGPQAARGDEARHALQRLFFQELWDETVGMAGVCMIRRLIGVAHVAEMEGIEDVEVRARCERRALKLGRALLVGGGEAYPDVQAMVSAAAAAAAAATSV